MARTTNEPPRLLLWVFLAIGVAVSVLGLTVIRDATSTPNGWVVVQGRVVDMRVSRTGDGTTYVPVAEYTDAAGAIHRVASSISSSGRPTIGEAIEVAYDPLSPSDSRVIGGVAGSFWLIVSGFGLFFAAIPAVLLFAGRGGGGSRSPTEGVISRDPVTGRETFARGRGQVILQMVLPLVGGLLFLGGAAFIVTLGFPTALASIVFVFFGMYMLIGGISALRHGFDPRVIEVGRDGVWFPFLGRRAWTDFSDVRLETYSGPSARGSADPGDGTIRVGRYRRLGFVPQDPELAGRRPWAERLSTSMGLGYYKLAARLTGIEPPALAPYGVTELEIGSVPFERLMAAVEAHRRVGEIGERASAIPSPLAAYVRGDDETGEAGEVAEPVLTIQGGGAAGLAANAALAVMPRRLRRLITFAQAGFFTGMIVALFAQVALASGSQAWFRLVIGGGVLLFALSVAQPAVRFVRAEREADRSVTTIVGVTVAAAVVGAAISIFLRGGG
jgi:hypothetical protein